MPFISHAISQDKEKVAAVLRSYGYDSLSYFHLQEERQYYFSPSGNSFLSFKVFNKVAIVATDPVGDPSETSLLLASFIQYAKLWKLQPCFIGLSSTFANVLGNNGLHIIKIGEEAILHTDTFDKSKLKKKVKRAVRHIEELGVDIFFFSPQQMPVSIRQQIEEISREWVKRKGGKEKGFSMTLKRIPNELDADCRIAVAVKDDIVIGYLCFAPAYQAATVSLDQARRRKDAPNGLNEFLIAKSTEYFREQHIKKISLNFASFSNMMRKDTTRFSIKRSVFRTLEKLYRCDTLRSFNEKFSPVWESRYLAYPTLTHIPLYMLAILRAER